MHGGRNSLTPQCWWRWSETNLNSELSCMHLQVCGEIRLKALQACSFFLQFILATCPVSFNRETELVTECLNPRLLSSIHVQSPHKSQLKSFHEPINASRFSSPPLLCCQGYFILIIDMHLRPREQVCKTIALSDPALGESK
jgi:hypothetical protein